MTEKESALIAACLKGEKAGWDAFVQQYSSLVYHTIRKTLAIHNTESRNEVVEDLYQEFFLSILQDNCRKLSQFRGDRGCSLASWLRVVAARLTIDFLRRERAPAVEITDLLRSDQPDSADLLNDQEEERLLAQALETLSPRDRLFVDLCFHRGLPAEDIAATLRVSVSAVYTQKSRILNRLRESLRKTGSLQGMET